MLLGVLSKRLSLPDSELILGFKEVKLSTMSSPHSLRMSSKDVITVYDKQSWAARQQTLRQQRDCLFKGTTEILSSEEDCQEKYVVFKISDRVGKDPVKLKAPCVLFHLIIPDSYRTRLFQMLSKCISKKTYKRNFNSIK